MARLILHVGPAKCGSTSIQQFFAAQQSPCVQKTHYILLNPLEISALNREAPDPSILADWARLFSLPVFGCEVLILSHEYLFQCPYAMEHICRLARNEMTGISIVGYSRRQSEFLISAYAQWLFREPDTVHAAIASIEQLGLDPVLFSGLERQLIDCIDKDFYNLEIFGYRIFDWHHAYKNIAQSLSKYGAVIKCGVLPNQGSGKTLLQDFCEKSDLTLNDAMKEASQRVFNVRFDFDIVEAINQGVVFGLDMPGPHEDNEIVDRLGSKMGNVEKMPAEINPSEFLSKLKCYIDSYFSESNRLFCEEFGLCAADFAPAVRYTKLEIFDIIKKEEARRASDKSNFIYKSRLLSAKLIKLCMEIAKSNPPSSKG